VPIKRSLGSAGSKVNTELSTTGIIDFKQDLIIPKECLLDVLDASVEREPYSLDFVSVSLIRSSSTSKRDRSPRWMAW